MKKGIKSVLGAFVEFPEEKQSPAMPSASSANISFPTPSFSTARPPISTGDIDKFANHFDELLKGANLPGPDYYEFSKMLDTLSSHLADPRARMSAAFAALSVQGLTKQKLQESANYYITMLEKDKDGFENAIKAKVQSEVDSRKEEMASLQKKIETLSAQIQQFTKDITDSQTAIGKLNNEVFEAQSKIQSSEGSYLTACDAVIQKIKNDINQIQANI